jgi:hypothetical protein
MPWYAVYALVLGWFVIVLPAAVAMGRASRRTPVVVAVEPAPEVVVEEPVHLAQVLSLDEARARRISA